jgi:hypothetical protein
VKIFVLAAAISFATVICPAEAQMGVPGAAAMGVPSSAPPLPRM